jgi:hypothetical protein
VGAFVIVIVIGTLGGMFVAMLRGFEIRKPGWIEIYITPLLKNIIIPPLLGMIIMACIARNFFGTYMNGFPTTWTSNLKYACHCTLLIRAGL